MPFRSDKERRYLFSQKPDVAAKIVKDAKAAGKPVTQKSPPPKRKSK